MLAFHTRNLALSIAPVGVRPLHPFDDDAVTQKFVFQRPPVVGITVAEDAALAPTSRFQGFLAREFWDRERRKAFAVDVGVTAGAACAIASLGGDGSAALSPVLLILGGAKTLLSALGLAWQVHDFRAGEDCLSRRLYERWSRWHVS